MPGGSTRHLPHVGWCDDAAVDAAVPVISPCRPRPHASMAAIRHLGLAASRLVPEVSRRHTAWRPI
jgi:hypothetical protein